MATWEYLADQSASKSLIIRKTLSRTSGAYGKTYIYDPETPEVTVTLRGTCLDRDERDDLLAIATTQDGTVSIVDNAGDTWSGRVISVSSTRIQGSSLFQATVTLRPQDDEV